LVRPDYVGFPHSGDAPWARAERTSLSLRRSRGIPAARPTERHLRSACTQVAICVVWPIALEDQKPKQEQEQEQEQGLRLSLLLLILIFIRDGSDDTNRDLGAG